MTTMILPPGPKGVAFARSAIGYSRAPLDAFSRLAREYGDVVQFMGPPMRAFLINHPDYLEDIQRRQGWNFQPSRVLVQRRLAPQGVATSSGYLHQHQRRALETVFTSEHLTQLTGTIVRRAEVAGQSWEDGLTLDIQREMSELMLAVFAGMMFGEGVWQDEQEMAALISVGDYVSRRSTYPWGIVPELLPVLADNRRFFQALRVVKEEIRLRIAERRLGGTDHGDVLSMLMTARDQADGSRLTDTQVCDDAITTIFAGATPVGQSLVWTWYLLSQNADAEATLHAELDDVLGGRPPTRDDLARLPFTRMVVQESLRLYPVSWILGREAISDFQLGDYTVPAGSILVLCPYVTHRDGRFFADPDQFIPERWAAEESASRPLFSFFPFSGGINGCPGQAWAPSMLALTLATVAQEVEDAARAFSADRAGPTVRPAREGRDADASGTARWDPRDADDIWRDAMTAEQPGQEIEPPAAGQVGKVNYRPDLPDLPETAVPAAAGKSSTWSLQAIVLGIGLLVVTVIFLIIIVQWALGQPTG